MWRNTALPVRILMLDARACIPIMCFVVYWSWTTLYIALAGSAISCRRWSSATGGPCCCATRPPAGCTACPLISRRRPMA